MDRQYSEAALAFKECPVCGNDVTSKGIEATFKNPKVTLRFCCWGHFETVKKNHQMEGE